MADRKYGHRGYQDGGSQSDHADRKKPERPPAGPRERPEGPRGRGLGAPTESVSRCRICGFKLRVGDGVSLDATCTSCNNDLHTCTNCIFFDSTRPNECRKPVLQRIQNKTKRNTCELFAPSTVQEFASDQSVKPADPRAAFDALFRKK